MIWRLALLFAFSFYAGATQAQSIPDSCRQGAAAAIPPEEYLIEVSKGERLVSARLADLGVPNPRFQCALARWSEPTDGLSTIVIVANMDSQQTLGKTKVTITPLARSDLLLSDPWDIGPGSLGVYLFAQEIKAVKVETEVNGQAYASVSRELSLDDCVPHKLEAALAKLKKLTTTHADKFDALAGHKSPMTWVVGVLVEKDSLQANGEIIMEWGSSRSDGIGCLQ